MLRFMPTHPRESNLSQSLPYVIRRRAGSLQGRIGFSSALLRARRHRMDRPWLTIRDCPVRAFDDGGLVTLAFLLANGQDFVDEQVKRGYGTSSEYVRELIRATSRGCAVDCARDRPPAIGGESEAALASRWARCSGMDAGDEPRIDRCSHRCGRRTANRKVASSRGTSPPGPKADK